MIAVITSLSIPQRQPADAGPSPGDVLMVDMLEQKWPQLRHPQ
jgi:hypothetical protein